MPLLRAFASTFAFVALAFSTATAAGGPVTTSASPIITKHSGIRQFARSVFRRASLPHQSAAVYYEAPITLAGSVVGADGQPMAGAVIWLEGGEARAQTNARGDFALSLPTSGPVSLICTSRGCAQQTMQLSTGSQPNDVYFVLRPAESNEAP